MFIAVGCDSYALVQDYWGDTYATGCLSVCYTNDSVVNGSCSGIGCCQTSIPKGVKSFSINVASYYNHTRVMDFNPCSYAFVVEDGSYNFSSLDLVNLQNKEGFPLVLDWAIINTTCNEARKNKTAYACKENSVCHDSLGIVVTAPEVSRGILTSPMVAKKRKEPTGRMYQKLLFLFAAMLAAVAAPASAQTLPGCPNQCGNLSISFPFGTKEGCYLNEDFLITCNASNAAFLGITKIEVLNISVQGQLRISIEAAYDCYNEAGNITRRARSILSVPKFPLSYRQNKFTATGCDTSTLIQGKRAHTYATGCVSYCVKHEDVINGSCAGIGCCQTSIPKGVLNFRASVGSFSDHQNVWNFNPCSYAFVVEEKAYDFSVLDLADLRGVTKFPVVLDWAIGNETCSDAQKKPETYACKDNSICHDSDNGPGYRCNCSDGYSGNPYLANGCKGVGIGVIVLLVASSWLYLVLKERKLIKLKEKFFRQNGGFMLKQKLCSPEGTSNATKLFTAEELKRATNNYDESTIIGKGGFEETEQLLHEQDNGFGHVDGGIASVGYCSMRDHQIPKLYPCNYAFIAEDGAYNFSSSDLDKNLQNITDLPMALDWSIGNQTSEQAKKDPKTFACKEFSYCIDSEDDSGDRTIAHLMYVEVHNSDIDECETLKPCNGRATIFLVVKTALVQQVLKATAGKMEQAAVFNKSWPTINPRGFLISSLH
ncbi:hypothetical protein GH714_022335 [Hevea brasiliensis]|uniref:Wall-associated receptor kinase galacturonan-binding domain-containing protein n=1 Tax=Hevea brasiliensis TaxID=3981 RepID=A0A6A6KRP8_HEVBR|nr:hypothetical protein GH714_022335 [Hevea brasiliensis]